jgi:hypothetical protein
MTGERVLRVDVPTALAHPSGWDTVIDWCVREAILQGAALYWRRADVLFEGVASPLAAERLAAARTVHRGLWFLSGRQPWRGGEVPGVAPCLRLALAAPGYELRRRQWAERLEEPATGAASGGSEPALSERLAGAFTLTPAQADTALEAATARASCRDSEARPNAVDLHEACREQLTFELGDLARRIEPEARLDFDDLILPPATKRQVEELRDRVLLRCAGAPRLGPDASRARAQGLVVMLTGPSGVGKTLTARWLAQQQGVDLFTVMLSAIVSKYVGETEKNLDRLFTAVEGTSAILFFDEGEALLGRRGSISNGQDRWANFEVNALLQRIEDVPNTILVSTNLRQNVDEAFLRRIHMLIEYPFPDERHRYLIWRQLLPLEFLDVEDEALRELAARFSLAGGGIRNVVTDANYRALAARSPGIQLRQIVAGIGREYQKTSRPISRGEFGQRFYEWVRQDVVDPGVGQAAP